MAHAAACDEYGWAVEHAASVLEEIEDEQAKHRLAVCEALAAGEPAPQHAADPVEPFVPSRPGKCFDTKT